MCGWNGVEKRQAWYDQCLNHPAAEQCQCMLQNSGRLGDLQGQICVFVHNDEDAQHNLHDAENQERQNDIRGVARPFRCLCPAIIALQRGISKVKPPPGRHDSVVQVAIFKQRDSLVWSVERPRSSTLTDGMYKSRGVHRAYIGGLLTSHLHFKIPTYFAHLQRRCSTAGVEEARCWSSAYPQPHPCIDGVPLLG